MNRILSVLLFFLLFAVLNVDGAISRTVITSNDSIPSPEDSIPVSTNDSIINPDSTGLSLDSLAKKDSFVKSDLDTLIYASATDSILFFTKHKRIEIYNDAIVKYRTTELKSGRIIVYMETSNLDAYATEVDSSGFLVKKQKPELVDGKDKYYGEVMKYNFKTKKGYITYASTDNQEASYSGVKIKKMDDKNYFVEGGFYTTCDHDPPHYGFACTQMKVIPDEQLIGKWIWLTFGGVPFPVPLPFAVIPLQKGRRSGLLAPAFGSREGYGRYLSRFGYYWAINDYLDLTVTGDYYTRGGWGLNSSFRYAKRYDFTGYVEAGYSNLTRGESTDPDKSVEKNWRLRMVHNQPLTPDSRIDANIEFVSSDYIRQNSSNYNDLLRNNIYSNVTYFQNFENLGAGLSVNYSREQELESGNISEVLPNIAFTKSVFYPFRSDDITNEQSWYEKLGVSYSGQFQNNRKSILGTLDVRGGFRHSISLSVSPKIGYINFTPNVSYQELWYNKQIERTSIYVPGPLGSNLMNSYQYSLMSSNALTDSIVTSDVDKLGFVRTFRVGLSATTKLYGMFPIDAFGIAALRHTVIPTLGYDFQPDFSTDGWGYFNSYTDASGRSVKYSKFEREIFGGAPMGEQQNLRLGISNIFEIKTKPDLTDTTSKEKKIQLLNFNAAMSYNFAADSLKLSNLFLDYRTQVLDFLSLSGSAVFSPYVWDANGRELNKFLISEGQGLVQLRNFNFSASAILIGDKAKEAGVADSGAIKEKVYYQNRNYQGLYADVDPDFSIPWSLNLSFNYNENRVTPIQVLKYTTLRADLNFNLTKYWKFSLGGSYDFENKEFAAPQIVVSRDLHCWIMNFIWNPIGTYTGYRFEIKVKAPQLQDLKLEKSDNFFSGRR